MLEITLNETTIHDLCLKMINMSRNGEYDYTYDIDGNGVINLLDVLLVIKVWNLLKQG
jgi:hypothetical protein